MNGGFDAIIARSRAPGRFVERRHFTLSRDRAVEKLREFTLRHPEQYILELVQAAVFAGARWIAIDVSADRLFFAWVGGRPYTAAQLTNVFDYLFADRAAAETRHVVQLAVALNALQQRQPRLLRVESGDGTGPGSVRMDIDARGRGQVGQPEQPFQGTYLVAEFATRWFARFTGQDWTREQSLVEERCAYCPIPILLNYRAPFGYRANRRIRLYGVADQEHFTDDEGRRGALGVPARAAPDQGIRFVIGGVWITTRTVPRLGEIRQGGGPPLPLVGVIADDRLRKTADQADIVEDVRWIDMLHAVQPVATRLIRRHLGGAAYTPPALPRRLAEPVGQGGAASPGGPAPEPLPDVLPQVAPRPALALDQLRALEDRAPVFWVDPDTAAALGPSGDPHRFPFCLLILTPGQALTLSHEAPALSLAPVTSAADAEFVSRIFTRQARHRSVRIPVVDGDGLGGHGELELRLHLQGQPPAWAGGVDDRVPVTVRVGSAATWCGTLELGLPAISVEVRLESVAGRGDDWGDDRAVAALGRMLRRHAWRLIADIEPVARARDLGAAERALLLGLLAMQSMARSFQGADGPVLTVSLPREWGATAAAVRRLPLVDTDRGSLCLDDLVAMLGRPHTDEGAMATVLRGADLEAAWPLVHRLGVGHLVDPDRPGHPLLAVADRARRGPSQWVAWTPSSARGDLPRALLWVGEDLRPEVGDPRWALIGHPVAGVGFARRADLPGAADEVDLEAGLALLQRVLEPVVREDRWRSLPRHAGGGDRDAGRSLDRARRMGRLVAVALAARARDLDARVLPTSDGSAWLPMRRLRPPAGEGSDRRRGVVRIALPGGPRVVEHDTVLLSWDALMVLHRARIPTPLRFDDPPEVWHSLADARPTAELDDWLLRERITVPGLDGWLGLRRPYDPTSAVLLQDSGELAALTEIDVHIPCHGLVWPLGADLTLSSAQRRLLDLGRLRLYQRLADHLDGTRPLPDHVDDAEGWRAVATCYAIDFAVHAWQHAPAASGDGTAARLLDAIRLPLADGQGAVGLRAWLALDPEQRPTPAGHAARYRSVVAVDSGSDRGGDPDARLRQLEARLGRALAQASPGGLIVRAAIHLEERDRHDAPVRAWQEASGSEFLALRFNELHPLVEAALTGAGPAREILLLEAARVAADALREMSGGVDLDLLLLHQLLAARRG